MSQPSVAVVILNWNGRKFLEKFLPSVLSSTYSNMEIIIADNASTDDSVAFIQSNYPQLRILNNTTNEGFAKGYNTALKQVESDYYVLLNSDVEVTPQWITPVIDLMEANPKITACQPKLLDFNNRSTFEYAGASGGWIDSFGYPFSRGRIFDTCEKDHGQYNEAVPCFWASGAALFVKAKAFWQVGGFDEYFFAHQEEIDLCWRLKSLGYEVYVQPQSVVYHVGGGTLPKGNSKKVFLNYRNNLIMMAKNLPLVTMVTKLPFRILLDGVSAWRALLKGDWGYWVAIFKAHFAFFSWLLSSKVSTPKIPRSFSFHSGIYNSSIVFAYFLKGRKYFSEIIGNK
jgi:GT2 family glycosyltransferase